MRSTDCILEPIANESKFRVCPGCGNLVPVERADCPYCGHTSVEALAVQQEAAKERNFFGALFTRSNPFTFLFIGINVGVFILEWLAGGMGAMSADPVTIQAFGAKVNSLIDQQHEYWRFITANFIHIGFLHVLLNNYALFIIGQEIERIYGSARFVILYLGTGILGVFASYLYSDTTSAGASAAIFGLFGVMATFAFRFRKEIPELLSKEIKQRVLPVIAINLVFGFSVAIVDNAAHIGGLVSGIVLALLIPYKRPEEAKTPIHWRVLQVLLLTLTFCSFAMAFINYNGPRPSLANLTRRSGDEAKIYFERMQEAQETLSRSFKSMAVLLGRKDGGEAGQQEINELDRAMQSLKGIRNINPEADGFRDRLIRLLTEQKSIFESYAQAGRNRDRLVARHIALGDEIKRFTAEYNDWIVEFLKEHGYELRESERAAISKLKPEGQWQ